MRHHFIKSLGFIAALALGACAGEIGSDIGDGSGDGSGSGSDEPVTCEQTRTYHDFDGTPLGTDRPTIEPGTDRVRIKPYAVLAAEYKSALGIDTFDTAAYQSTFGRPPARWYQEPQASANTIYAAFALAYDGCTQATATNAQYSTAPTAAAAEIVCHDFIRRAWHRDASTEETASCVDFAVNQTKASDTPRVRWAYTCASILSASGFLAY